MLMCVFAHSCFIKNPPVGSWDKNPYFFRGVLSKELSSLEFYS
jgi:hypothetical protein